MIDTNQEILRPVIALIAWTLVMLVWLMATRLPAMKAAGVDLGKLIGGKGTDADGALPPRVQWKAHNHNHRSEEHTSELQSLMRISYAVFCLKKKKTKKQKKHY